MGEANILFENVLPILKENGLFAITIQRNDSVSVQLGDDHRYWHSLKYIKELMEKYDFYLYAQKDISLRIEDDQAVPGTVLIVKKSKGLGICL